MEENFYLACRSMSTQRISKEMDGTGKRLAEHGSHHSLIFQSTVKRTKVDDAISEHNGSEIPKRAKVENDVTASAKLPNDTRIKDTKSLVSCAKADALKQKKTQKNVKGIEKEDKLKCLAARGSTQACNKGKTNSQHVQLTNGHPPSKLGNKVSVSKELRRGCVGLDYSKHGVFIAGNSLVEPKSSMGMVQAHDKLIKDGIWDYSLTGKKVGKKSPTEYMDLNNAKSALEIVVAGSGGSKLNARTDVSPFPESIDMWTVACYECPEAVSRNKVLKSVELFEEEYTKLLQERKRGRNERGKDINRIDVRAAMILKDKGMWVNTDQEVGKVPGIEIGDQFQYRAELAVVGLHSRFSAGIDYIRVGEKLFATCIVDSGRYKNERRTPDVFIYTGEGGNPKISRKKPEDQKLKCGNFALKTSMDAKLPVRVIHCCRSLKAPNTLGVNNGSGLRYTYDGLYTVSSYWKERDESGKLVFKFKMTRMPDQPNLAIESLSEARKPTPEGAQGMIAGMSLPKKKKLMLSVNTTTKKKPARCAYNTVLDGCSSSRRSEYSHSEKSSDPIRNNGEGGPVIKAKSIAYQSGLSGK